MDGDRNTGAIEAHDKILYVERDSAEPIVGAPYSYHECELLRWQTIHIWFCRIQPPHERTSGCSCGGGGSNFNL